MKTPGPAHPITIEPSSKTVAVTFAGQVIAKSDRALVLREASIPPVLYIPREDVNMALVERTKHATHCPFKGDASYYSIKAGGERSENAIWTYEEPFPAVAAIKDHMAFYTNRGAKIEEIPNS